MNQQKLRVHSANWLVTLLVGMLGLTDGYAQAVLTISGDVTKPLTFQAADLASIPHTDVTAKDHDGKEHRYSGVPVVELLKRAGATLGSELRGKNLSKCVLVKAKDGYQVVFALAELDPDFATRPILLVDRADGEPLPQGVGPYRIVVPNEKKMGRWVREVTAFDVKNVN